MEEIKQTSTTKTTYFRYLVIILIFVQLIDSYTTSFPTLVPSSIINEFLYGFPENIGASIFAFVTGLASVGMYFCAFNTYLSDKLGRKTMLAVTVFGMVLVALLINFSVSIIDFTIYLLFLWFFTRSDVWMIYIGEESPREKRAFWTNIILIFGLLGAILAPIVRSRFITETASNWRGITWLVILIGVPLGLLIVFTLKEPKIYTDMKDDLESKQRIIGLKENVSGLFKSENRTQIIVCLIISVILGMNSVFRNLVEEAVSSSPYLNQQEISLVMLIGVLAVYMAVILIGIFADKFGRIPLLYVFSILIPIARIMFAIVAFQPLLTFPLTSLFIGMSEFGYWGGWITLSIVVMELVPTESRGTGSGLKSFFGAFGITIGFLSTALMTYISNLSIAFVILGLFGIIIVPLVYKYLNETKKVDMKDISRLKA
ncbi:MAG: MFS transporter [Candidatus Lokiarchaeota archaeon]|nr:MFS transporter [Candidatus Lokiarchaeota archaeon]